MSVSHHALVQCSAAWSNPSCLQATLAAWSVNISPHTVIHTPCRNISNRPAECNDASIFNQIVLTKCSFDKDTKIQYSCWELTSGSLPSFSHQCSATELRQLGNHLHNPLHVMHSWQISMGAYELSPWYQLRQHNLQLPISGAHYCDQHLAPWPQICTHNIIQMVDATASTMATNMHTQHYTKNFHREFIDTK